MIMQKDKKDEIVFKGKIFEMIKRPVKIGEKIKDFEIARRSPGVRIIITENKKILLTKEFRYELDDYTYRIPGGKVFDNLDDYRNAMKENPDIIFHAKKAAERECIEETGLIPEDIEYYHTSVCGATVEWDLIYFIVTDFRKNENGSEPEEGEDIRPEWKSMEDAKIMCLDKNISEERSVCVLLRFIEENI